VFGLPVGMTFMGTAWSEPTLIRLAAGFEAASSARRVPQFLPTFPGGFPPDRASAVAPSRAALKRQLDRYMGLRRRPLLL
jgi:hypothetical protein